MNARICASPGCRTIQTGSKCAMCKKPTKLLPKLSLSPIGVEGTVHLQHTANKGYSLLVETPSGSDNCHVRLSDLLQSAQSHLPGVNEAGGLLIMDTLREAARLIRTKNTGHWAGWIIYLIDTLHAHTANATYLELLKDLKAAIDLAVHHFEPPIPNDDDVQHLAYTTTLHTGDTPPRGT